MAGVGTTAGLDVRADEVCERMDGFNAVPDRHRALAESRTEGAEKTRSGGPASAAQSPESNDGYRPTISSAGAATPHRRSDAGIR